MDGTEYRWRDMYRCMKYIRSLLGAVWLDGKMVTVEEGLGVEV